MIAYICLVGVSLICSATGFVTIPAPMHGASCSARVSAAREARPNRRAAPAASATWHAVCQRPRSRVGVEVASGIDGQGEPEAEGAAPRLKRVRRRRKDASSVVLADEDDDIVASSPSNQQPPPPAVTFGSTPATAMIDEEEEEEGEEEEEEEGGLKEGGPKLVAPVRVSSGGTKGTKVRVDNTEDEITEKLAGVASAATGVAGDAASIVGGAAKSAIGAAISALGQGEDASADDFDLEKVPGLGEGRRVTRIGKSKADLADLGADIERFRKQESRQPDGAGESLAAGAKDLISTIITVDFFVVIAFMLWFIAGVVSSYGFSNSFLLDQFNDKWTPVVQPALGVLMGGTIAGGVVSKLGESGDGEDVGR